MPGDYWLEHGTDQVCMPLIDLASLVARLMQLRCSEGALTDMLAERVITCDLPRLIKYLPEEAYIEIAGKDGLLAEGT